MPPGQPSWISDRNNFSYFLSTGYPDGFLIGTILAIFDLQVIPMLPTKFQVNWPSGSEEAKNSGHLGTILAIFDLQVIPMLRTKFQKVGPGV